jgi:hypothetical protein
MKEIAHVAHAMLRKAIHEFHTAVSSVVSSIWDGLRDLYAWHRRLMATNAAYPLALLAIGKSIIRLATPSSAIAAAAVALLAALLDLRNQEEGPDWDEYY